MRRKPPALRPGDRVAVVAPASVFDRAEFDRGVAALRALELEPVVDASVFDQHRYLAGPAPARAAAFLTAWEDPDIAGVMAVRGGYGSAELLPLIDASLIRARSKVVIGSSDLTALLTFITQHGGLVTFHGPMVVTLGGGPDRYDAMSLRRAVMSAEPMGDVAEGAFEVWQAGHARGPLLGGTLTQLVASLGTPFAFDPPPGFVLLLDEVGERPYRIERMLTQLTQAGVLGRAGGLVCAEFPECDEPDGAVTARDVLREVASQVEGPVVFGVPTGHTRRPMITLPLGVETTVDGDGGRLVVDEAAVV